MLARLLKARDENKEGGFTLIELLVVMIIIGILAAIAIPVFLSQQKKANDTAAKSDASVIGQDVAAYYVDGTSSLTATQTTTTTGDGTFTLVDGTGAKADSGNLSKYDMVVGADGTKGGSISNGDGTWCVGVYSTKGSGAYFYSSTKGLLSSTVTTNNKGVVTGVNTVAGCSAS